MGMEGMRVVMIMVMVIVAVVVMIGFRGLKIDHNFFGLLALQQIPLGNTRAARFIGHVLAVTAIAALFVFDFFSHIWRSQLNFLHFLCTSPLRSELLDTQNKKLFYQQNDEESDHHHRVHDWEVIDGFVPLRKGFRCIRKNVKKTES